MQSTIEYSKPKGQPHDSSVEHLARRIRQYSLVQIFHATSGHPGGALSCADIMAHLWASELRGVAPWTDDPERDRFVLSKGHACPALYAAAMEMGLLAPSQMKQLRKLGSPLQGHPHVTDLPWVESSTGSLGQGFSTAIGMALGLRFKRIKARTYAMLGDGEMQEGEVWEGAMFAAHQGMDNLCAIVDYNKMQSDDLNENIVGLEPLDAKWRAFGWHVVVLDGHDHVAIEQAFQEARDTKGKPTVLIAHTLKGKGVSYMEASPLWHGSVCLRREETEQALRELGMSDAAIFEVLNE